MEKFVLGVDYGTLSARAVLCSTHNGRVIAQAEQTYPHAVMDKCLPDGTPLPFGFQLQHPADYVYALEMSVTRALQQSGIDPAQVVGMALDFTGSTVIPLDKNGVPLCEREDMRSRPHAYVKLWKHRTAQKEADLLTALCQKYQPDMLNEYGGRVGSEALFPKVLQVIEEDPGVFALTDQFVEGGDYMLRVLTGESVRCTSMAALKAFYRKGKGYPDFLKEAHPAFDHPENTFLRGRMCDPSEIAGYLTPEMACKLGLPAGIPVAGGHYDAHAAMYAVNVRGEGDAMMTLGTSSGLIFCDRRKSFVQGAVTTVWEADLPGTYGYASGQAAFGDMLGWYVNRAVPPQVTQDAQKAGLDVHAFLSREAEKLRPGESGLVALDWWNGARSCLMDGELSGLMLGMTLQTTPAHIYRALLESLAFGMRRMLDSYRDAGFDIRLLCACGGISLKNPFFMQMLSDVTHLPIRTSKPAPAAAVGACMLAATAAGEYKTLWDAMEHMNCLDEGMYHPNADNARLYDRLYAEYLVLHDAFGLENNVMKRLRKLQLAVREEKQ